MEDALELLERLVDSEALTAERWVAGLVEDSWELVVVDGDVGELAGISKFEMTRANEK